MQTTKNDGLKNIVKSRPSWDEYFLNMLNAVSTRATCDRGKSSAILVRNNRIISTGYVGAPIGLPSCDEVGHQMRRIVVMEIPSYTDIGTEVCEAGYETSEHCIRTLHAEHNAILNCAKEGVSTIGSTVYCTMVPCRNCAMAIIQAGIIRVVAKHPYQKGEESIEMFKTVGIELEVLSTKELY